MTDRRSLFTMAVLGGVSALGIKPEDAFAALSAEHEERSEAESRRARAHVDVAPGAIDPNFAEGVITSINGTMLMVSGSDGVLHRIQATNATSIWKLKPTTFDTAAVGDGLYARGVRMPDGRLAADSIWVNIVNVEAHIVSIGRNVINLEHHGSRIVGHVVPGVTATVYNGTPAVSDMSLLQVGKHVKVLGAWRPGTNEVDLSTVYAGV